MAAEDSAQGQGAPRRRGRPPGAKSTSTTRTRRKRLGGTELTQQLNHMVAELIKENRKLKRQIVKLTEEGADRASSAIDRTLRTIQRRVQKALAAPAKRRRRKTTATTAARKKPVATRKRRKAS